MPFRQYTHFNSDTLQAMTAAYDAAITKVGSKQAIRLTLLHRRNPLTRLVPGDGCWPVSTLMAEFENGRCLL
jgi:hypothetical protein